MDTHKQGQARYLNDPDRCDRSKALAVKVVGDAMARGISVEHIIRHALPKLPIARLELLLNLVRQILATKYEAAGRWPAQLKTSH